MSATKKNRFAALSRKAPEKSDTEPKRRPLDDYETPEEVTALLTWVIRFSPASIYDPACGSGRILRHFDGLPGDYATFGTDIKTGEDYLKDVHPWHGAVVTNPPFKFADEFVNTALDSTRGGVAMLLNSGFLHGQNRHASMWRYTPPRYVVPIPFRVSFYIGDTGERTDSQVFSHCWFVWDGKMHRKSGQTEILTIHSPDLPRIVA